MDWTAIGVGVVGITFGIYQGLRSLASDQRKQRDENERQRRRLQSQLRRAYGWGDLLDGWITEQRMRLRRHNLAEHPTGDGKVIVAELPDEIEAGIRSYVEADDHER